MGFPRQEYWSGLPFPSPGDLPDPGIESSSPALQVGSLPLSHRGKPMNQLRIQLRNCFAIYFVLNEEHLGQGWCGNFEIFYVVLLEPFVKFHHLIHIHVKSVRLLSNIRGRLELPWNGRITALIRAHTGQKSIGIVFPCLEARLTFSLIWFQISKLKLPSSGNQGLCSTTVWR